MNAAQIGAGVSGLGVLGAAITLLSSGTPVRAIELDFDAGLEKPAAEVRACFSSADGIERWLNAAAAQRGTPSVSVSAQGEGRFQVSAGEHIEQWAMLSSDDRSVTYTITSDKVTVTRTLRLQSDTDSTTLYWSESGRLPAFITLLMLGEDVGLDAYLDTAEALDAASCS